jgi:hypothetical protein
MQISPLGGWLVSALSIPFGRMAQSSADFNPSYNHINSAPKQARLQTTSRSHHHATHKQTYCMQNVLVLISVCEKINKKSGIGRQIFIFT